MLSLTLQYLNAYNLYSEINDVCIYFQCWRHSRSSINMPPRGCENTVTVLCSHLSKHQLCHESGVCAPSKPHQHCHLHHLHKSWKHKHCDNITSHLTDICRTIRMSKVSMMQMANHYHPGYWSISNFLLEWIHDSWITSRIYRVISVLDKDVLHRKWHLHKKWQENPHSWTRFHVHCFGKIGMI